MKINITIIILVLSLSMTAQTKFAVDYSVGFPLSETSDLFESTSWRGVNFDFSYFVKTNIAIGISGGWQVFDDARGYVSQTSGTETISGYKYHYLNSVPIFATGSYYFNNTGEISPYGSLGVGMVINTLEEDIGLYAIETTATQFSLRPEFGIDYEVNYGFGVRASARYHMVFEGGDLPNLSYLALTLGVVWTN